MGSYPIDTEVMRVERRGRLSTTGLNRVHDIGTGPIGTRAFSLAVGVQTGGFEPPRPITPAHKCEDA
eukprot:2648590-Rhodomonas_salina.1